MRLRQIKEGGRRDTRPHHQPRAAGYGLWHLQSIHEDMAVGAGYTRQMGDDMALAIAMLKAAPDPLILRHTLR